MKLRYFLKVFLFIVFMQNSAGALNKKVLAPPESFSQDSSDYAKKKSKYFDFITNVFIDVEFLYMFAKSSNMDWAQIGISVLERSTAPSVELVPKEILHFGTHWDPGARVGVGFLFDHDGWDLYFNATLFYNRKDESASVALLPDEVIDDPGVKFLSIGNWENPSFGVLLDRGSGIWAFLLNQYDLELGRNFFISKWLSVRPYVGIRGARTENRLRINASFDATEVGDAIRTRVSFSQDYWGVGLLAGLQSSWFFAKKWALWGNVDTSLIYGRFDVKRNHHVFQTDFFAVTSRDFRSTSNGNFFGTQPIVDLAIGLRWQDFFNQNRNKILFDLGWESHIWLKHIAFYKFFGQQSTDFRENRVQGDVSFSGIVVRGRLDF